MTTTTPQRVLLTGAGTGIARLAAISLAKVGHIVYASMRDPEGRNAEKAQSLRDAAAGSAGTMSIVELDVLSDQSPVDAVARIEDEVGGLDRVGRCALWDRDDDPHARGVHPGHRTLR